MSAGTTEHHHDHDEEEEGERIIARVERLTRDDVPVGQSLVALDPAIMQKHGIAPDAVLEVLTPEDITLLVRVLPPSPDDNGLGIIRCDRYLRQSLRTRLNTPVELKVLDAQPVRQVFLQPPLDLLEAHRLAEHLQEHLAEDRTVVAPGTFIYLPISHEGNGAAALFYVARIDDAPGYVGPKSRVFLIEPDEHEVDVQLDVSLDDVGGLDAELRAVLDLVQLPLQFPGVYRQLGIQAPRGIILHGPPGTGKTHMSRALAQELDVRFYYINGPEIVGTLHGETEGTLRKLFGEAAHHAPSIICIDEIDAIARSRRDLGSHTDVRAVTQLLSADGRAAQDRRRRRDRHDQSARDARSGVPACRPLRPRDLHRTARRSKRGSTSCASIPGTCRSRKASPTTCRSSRRRRTASSAPTWSSCAAKPDSRACGGSPRQRGSRASMPAGKS